MDIVKSSRHQKIIGNFGESLICNWLSRSGFEVAIVDHTGIDIVAYDPATQQRLGITVKSRTRTAGKEDQSVNLYDEIDYKKFLDACEFFACKPWIGVYVEGTLRSDVFLTSLQNYEKNYGRDVKIKAWKMTSKYRERYEKDSRIKHIRIDFHTTNWDFKELEGHEA
jgi:hypothetical protein